jgi:excisionase family DNA binding protein
MSAESAQSIECRGVPPSDKPLEFRGSGESGAVHSVPAGPSITARFGAYLVPTSEAVGRLFTVRELAARWAVCAATIYSLAKSGRLESLRIGNSIRFMATTVADYEQTRVGAKAERHPDPNTHC